MTADKLPPRHSPASGAIKAGAMISAVFAAGLVAVGLVGVCTARMGQAVTSETEASTSVPGRSIERGGTLIAYEILF